MPNLENDLTTASHWIADALQSSGYRADFTPTSLWEIDRFCGAQVAQGKPRASGLLGTDLGARVFALGAYTGEVIRQALGGEWHTDDSDPQGEVNVELELPDGTRIWPVQRVISRVQDGSEGSIASYAAVLGVSVGPRPPKRESVDCSDAEFRPRVAKHNRHLQCARRKVRQNASPCRPNDGAKQTGYNATSLTGEAR